MPKELFTRQAYLDVLNEALRHHPEWQPGMKFIFFPAGAKARTATGVGFSGSVDKKAVFDQIEYVASRLCWTDTD